MLSQPHHKHAGNFHSQAAAWAAPGQHAGPNAAVANCQAAAAQSAPPPGAQQVTSTLDRVLAEDAHAQTLLLPTPFNISPIYVSRDDLLAFVEAQQYGAAHLGISLPLLTGTFLLVPSAQLEAPAFSSGSNDRTTSSDSGNSTFSAAIPWRLRQVLAVVPAPSGDPADATVVLVGGQRVTAGAVRDGQLADMPDHEYLCCEVAALQRQGQLRQLQVFDVAHMAWRLRVACQLHEGVETNKEGGQVSVGLDCFARILQNLPSPGWTRDEVLPFFELNPYQPPVSPNQPSQLLSTEQHSLLLQGAAAAWQHYAQCKLAGQQPQSVMQFVPWRPLAKEMEGTADPKGVASPAGSAVSNCTQAAAGSPTVDASVDGRAYQNSPGIGDSIQSSMLARKPDARPANKNGGVASQQARMPDMHDVLLDSDEALLQGLFDAANTAKAQRMSSPSVPAQAPVNRQKTDSRPAGRQQAAGPRVEAGRTFKSAGQEATRGQLENRGADPMPVAGRQTPMPRVEGRTFPAERQRAAGKQDPVPQVEQGRTGQRAAGCAAWVEDRCAFPPQGRRSAGPRDEHEHTFPRGQDRVRPRDGPQHNFPAGEQRAEGPRGDNGPSRSHDGQRAAGPQLPRGHTFPEGGHKAEGTRDGYGRCYPQGRQRATGPEVDYRGPFPDVGRRPDGPMGGYGRPYHQAEQRAAGPQFEHGRNFQAERQRATGTHGDCAMSEGGRQASGPRGGQKRTFPEGGPHAAGSEVKRGRTFWEGAQQAARLPCHHDHAVGGRRAAEPALSGHGAPRGEHERSNGRGEPGNKSELTLVLKDTQAALKAAAAQLKLQQQKMDDIRARNAQSSAMGGSTAAGPVVPGRVAPRVQHERRSGQAEPENDSKLALTQRALEGLKESHAALEAAAAQLKLSQQQQRVLERQQQKLLQWQQDQLQAYLKQQEERAKASQQQPADQPPPSNVPPGMTPPPWATTHKPSDPGSNPGFS